GAVRAERGAARGGVAQGRPADLALEASVANELGGGLVVEAEGIVAGGGTGDGAQARVRPTGGAGIDKEKLAAGAHLEGEAAGAGGSGKRQRRGRADVDHDRRRPALEAYVARGRVGARRGRWTVAVGEHRRQRIALGRPGRIEAR